MYVLAAVLQDEAKKDDAEKLLKFAKIVYHIIEKSEEDNKIYEIYVPETEIEEFQKMLLMR